MLDDQVSEQAKPAAVLIPICKQPESDTGWQLIFTRRTQNVADHKGQVAFPGGRADVCDATMVDTALREAQEEIGLDQEVVRILGQLDPLYTISNYLVTPIIGLIPSAHKFSPQPVEVERVFTIPLKWLADRSHFEIRQREVKFPAWPKPNTLRVIYFNEYDGEVLWGVSAEITIRLLNKLYLI